MTRPRRRAPMSEDSAQQIASAMADPRRFEILKMIGARETGLNCSHVRECVDIAAPTLSHHMKELRAANLITVTREGREMHYELRRDVLEAFLGLVRSELLPPP